MVEKKKTRTLYLSRLSRVGSKFPNLKILIFLLLPQNFTTNQGLHSKFPHPTPRTAYQCPYAKEMRWIGPKMTELEPFSWRRSKIHEILKLRFSTFWPKSWFQRYGPNFGGIDPIFFFCCPIIAYIFGSYHALPLNPEFWVNLRAQSSPMVNCNKKSRVN